MKESSTALSKTEQAILNAKTPEDYVDLSVRSKLPPRAKARLAKDWMRKTGCSVEDIVRARNRHPYWKAKKQENASERAKNRLAMHSYAAGSEIEWTSELVAEFLEKNRRDKDGNYVYRDWQLAEHFGTTIPSIQYMRRKFIRLQGAVGAQALKKNKLVESMKRSEVVLKKVASGEIKVKDLAKKAPAKKAGKKATTAKKAAAKKPAAAKKVAKKPAKKVAAKKPAKKVAAKKPAAKKVAAKKVAAKKPAKKVAAKKPAKKVAAKKPAKKAAAKKPAAKKAVAKKPAAKKVAAKKPAAKKPVAKKAPAVKPVVVPVIPSVVPEL